MVVKKRRIVLHEAAGWCDREREMPLQRNSIYRIRSMTKPFIGTAVLVLAEEGRLNLDDLIAKHISSFDNERSGEITILQLLAHRGGFIQDEYPPRYWWHSTLREAVNTVGETGPPNPPGIEFRYSDLNSATLGAIVAELTGAPVEQFLKTRIFEPLNMSDTFSRFTPDSPWASRMNSTYKWDRGSWRKYWDNTMKQETPFFRASGGLYSTVFDYARFLTAWMDRGRINNDRILAESTVLKALRRPEGFAAMAGHAPVKYYGLHWEIYAEASSKEELPAFGHGGSDGTVAIAIPGQDILVFYFTQSRHNDVKMEFIRIALELLSH